MNKSNRIRRAACISLLALAAVCVLIGILGIALLQSNKIILKYSDLGSPQTEFFTDEQLSSRLSDDLTVFDGKLYVGGGDYDANTGPVHIFAYDIENKKWERSDEPLPDEQIKRFCAIDGKLVATGTDPKGDWTLGNYYVLGEDGWQTVRALPFGIHCFDVATAQGEMFFGLGVSSGNYPAVRFDGESYTPIEFIKGGAPLDTSANEIIRVYNFFKYNGSLFAFLSLDAKSEVGETLGYFMELYVYEDGAFNYVSGALPAADLSEIAVNGSDVYLIINETLLKTSDLMSFSAVSLGADLKASDIIKTEDGIFVLAYRQAHNEIYEISVFEQTEDGFSKLFGILTKSPAGSFCKYKDSFYVSLGNRQTPTADSGRVVRIKTK